MSGTPKIGAEMILIILVSYLSTELGFKCTLGVRTFELWIPCSQC